MPERFVTFNNEKIPIYTKEEIKNIKAAGLIAYEVLEFIKPFVKVGVTTLELNNLCHNFMNKQGVIPAPLGYKGYPKATCISVNHVVCHGIPTESKILTAADIFNLDITVIKNGFYGDTSRMYSVEKPSIKAQNLINVTFECLMLAMEIVKPGIELGEIGRVIEEHAHKNGFSVVEDFCGHGIGTEFHHPPQVLHFRSKHKSVVLEEGMVFTIEPMINAGRKEVTILNDGWTAITKDRSLSAQFEHTIAVTKNGYEILTLP